MKIVINKCHGGFGVSNEVFNYLIEKKKWVVGEYGRIMLSDALGEKYFFNDDDYTLKFRSDPDLIEAIESVGLEQASGEYSKLRIVEIPDEINRDNIIIDDFNGLEQIKEVGRSWG